MQFNGPDKKEIKKMQLSLKYAFMVKQNKKCKLVLLKYNLMVQTKGNLKKKRLIFKYNYSSGQMKPKNVSCFY